MDNCFAYNVLPILSLVSNYYVPRNFQQNRASSMISLSFQRHDTYTIEDNVHGRT